MMSTPAPSLSELNRLLAETPFVQPYGFRVESTAVGECTLIVPFQPSLERPGGIVSGLTMMGAAATQSEKPDGTRMTGASAIWSQR